MTHPAIVPGRTAVITGAASGIGLAAAQRLAARGMAVCMADVNADMLEQEAAALRATGATVLAVPTDVSDVAQVEALRDSAAGLGPVSVLMNNAGRETKGAIDAGPAAWHAILDTNLWGVINGVQAFLPMLRKVGGPAAIINTGSKQGITTPPGNTAYNVSKAAIKVLTEGLAHDLLGSQVTAHLLIPGFTFTGFTRVRTATKPDGAWLPEQVVDFMLDGMARGDFYILCPDNDTTRAQDEKRMQWAADDIIQNRPPLSRWHPDYAEAFKTYMAS
jgi:NAD(P)-dependent dehydrogenase (short-subunit alcohol dehydrogenase family)